MESLFQIKIGDLIKGTIKSISPFGCIVDLQITNPEQNIVGLLHINDINDASSWKIAHPSELFSLGDEVEVVIINLIPEERRISLGMKQANTTTWGKLKIGSKVKGIFKKIIDYGCLIEIEDGIIGVVHVSEMSWSKKKTYFSFGEEVNVMILGIDNEKKKSV